MSSLNIAPKPYYSVSFDPCSEISSICARRIFLLKRNGFYESYTEALEGGNAEICAWWGGAGANIYLYKTSRMDRMPASFLYQSVEYSDSVFALSIADYCWLPAQKTRRFFSASWKITRTSIAFNGFQARVWRIYSKFLITDLALSHLRSPYSSFQ